MATHLGSYLNLCTPKGRIIKGSTYELVTSEWKWNPATKRYEEKPLPQDKHKRSFTFALRKDDPAVQEMMQKIYLHARGIYAPYPDIVRAIDLLIKPKSGFAWKIYDGDLPNQNTGKVDANGVGCWLLQFDCWPPREFSTIAWNNKAIAPETVKNGYECDIAFSVIDNGLVQSIPGGASSGVYLNATFVRYLGTGLEIVRGPSADQLMPAVAAPPMPAEQASVPSSNAFAAQAPVPSSNAFAAQAPSDPVPAFAPAPVSSFTPPSLPDTADVQIARDAGTKAPVRELENQSGASGSAETASPISGFATGDAV